MELWGDDSILKGVSQPNPLDGGHQKYIKMKNLAKFSKWVSELTWESVGQFFVRIFVAVMSFFNISTGKKKTDSKESALLRFSPKNMIPTDSDESIWKFSPEESTPAETVVETAEPENSSIIKEEIVVSPDAYIVDEHDPSLFHSLKSQALHIRVIKNPSGSKTKNKDEMAFACSLPHKLKATEIVIALFPQLILVDSSKSHEVLVLKSAASNFDELMEPILHFLFAHLYHHYSWMEEKQIVLVERHNSGTLGFNLRLETRYHLPLGISLIAINGIESSIGSPGDFPICMDHKNHYEFSLSKAKTFTWEELLPEIKKVFNAYFPAGVEFKGFME